ncbi:MAG: hypothetical protein WC812_03130 [Candidatus Pacearchaeota archaeon]|jgi:hypothetical protein
MKQLQNLINKFKEKLNPEWFSADEIKPFLKANGIDIETIGFPDIELRNELSGLSRYNVYFSKIKVVPIKYEDNVSLIITGNYETQAQITRTDKSGNHTPGTPVKYSFEIEKNKLNLKRRNKK